MRIINVSDGSWILLGVFHHLIFDAASAEIVLSQLSTAVDALSEGGAAVAPECQYSPNDHALAQAASRTQRARATRPSSQTGSADS